MKITAFFVCFMGIIFFSSTLNDACYGLISNILSIIFVLGGTLIATLISFPLAKLKEIWPAVKKAYIAEPFDYADKARSILHLARKYRRTGFKCLEEASQSINHKYLTIGFNMIAANCTWQQITSALEQEYIFDSLENNTVERIIRSMAKYAPAFGLAGTILGLMKIFPQLANPHNIGSAMSLALLTTLYGVLASNLLLLPLASKLRDNAVDDEIMYRFIMEALLCLHQREYAVVIEQRLCALMPRQALHAYRTCRPETSQLNLAENA